MGKLHIESKSAGLEKNVIILSIEGCVNETTLHTLEEKMTALVREKTQGCTYI